MSAADIEHRVEVLEMRCAELEKRLQRQPARGAWRDVVGMFADDPQIEALHQEAARIREQDRTSSRDRGKS